jgi:hypothetical protein
LSTSPARAIAGVLLGLACAYAAAAGAAAREPDRALQKLLDKAKLKYQLDEDGDYKLTIDLGDGRTQLVYVRSVVHDFGTLKVREVLSIGASSAEAELSADLAKRLMRENADTKLGAWSAQGRYAIYVSKIPANADARALADAIELTATIADRLERDVSQGKDEF